MLYTSSWYGTNCGEACWRCPYPDNAKPCGQTDKQVKNELNNSSEKKEV